MRIYILIAFAAFLSGTALAQAEDYTCQGKEVWWDLDYIYDQPTTFEFSFDPSRPAFRWAMIEAIRMQPVDHLGEDGKYVLISDYDTWEYATFDPASGALYYKEGDEEIEGSIINAICVVK